MQRMDLKRCKLQKGYITTKKKRENSRIDQKRNQKCVVENTKLIVGRVLELPMHILFDILSRLPMKTIFSCKCVCKMFLKILTDHYFAELHLTKGHKDDRCLIVQSLICPSDFSIAYSSDLEKPSAFPSLRSDHDSNSRPWRSLAVPPIVSQSKTPLTVFLVGSCNGLLCLAYKHKGLTSFYVCNPILGEFMILPQNRSNGRIGGFGFCPKSKLYKVICFVATTYCEIHTLGTNDWRRMENIPYPDYFGTVGSSLNGCVHWISRSSDISKTICSLNLETEQFYFLSPPSHFNRDTIRRMSSMKAGEICGLFCVFYMLDLAQVEVFVMKEYGVESSWTKEFSVDLKFSFLPLSFYLIHPLKLFNNGDLLVRYIIGGTSLFYFSPQKRIFKEFIVPTMFDVIIHAPSFVSLKDIVGEKNVKFDRTDGSDLEIKKCAYETSRGVVSQIESQEDVGGSYIDYTYSIKGSLWYDEEVLRLQQAIPRNRYNTKTSTRIAWGLVAQEVVTRSPNQCKWKWHVMRKCGLVRAGFVEVVRRN